MGVSDRYWASASGGAGDSDPSGEEHERGGDPTEPQDAAGDDAGGPEGHGEGGGAAAPSEAPRRRPARGKALEDTEAWLRRLEQAGFSRSEASRLIFERMRPREEGLVRS